MFVPSSGNRGYSRNRKFPFKGTPLSKNALGRSVQHHHSDGPGELSPVIPGAEKSGEMHTDEASATSFQLLSDWMREGEPEWTVRRFSRCKQIHLCLAELLPYQLDHLGVESPFSGPQPLSRQDVCCYIVGPRVESYLQRQQLPLGPEEDLACQFAKDMTANPPGDLSRRPPMCCLSGQYMVAPEIC